MRTVFESVLPRGFLDFTEFDGKLHVSCAFNRKGRGVTLEIPPTDTADLAEALLGYLDRETRLSVIESVLKVGQKKETGDGGASQPSNETLLSTESTGKNAV